MAEIVQEIITVADFVELILNTEIPGAKDWFKKFKAGIPPFSWETFCKFNTTAQVVDHIAFGISTQISRQVREMWGHYDHRRVLENGHRFLQEIHKKATEIGLDIDIRTIDMILSPQ